MGLWRMEMTPLILLILGVSGLHADSHSLRYYKTAISAPGSGLPVFSIVGYVDDREIDNYNSDTRRNLPKTEWMKKLEPEYWEDQTQIGQANEPVHKHNVQTLMQRFNQTGGIHIVQLMEGCELRDDGSTAGYEQHGYDGRDFLYLDTQRGLWIPAMHEAQITTQRWNSPEVREGERQKNYVENECIEWLKKYINNGREDLERRESTMTSSQRFKLWTDPWDLSRRYPCAPFPRLSGSVLWTVLSTYLLHASATYLLRPEVKVWGRQHPDGVTRLQCLAYGFHPRAVDVKWVRNGEDHIPSDEASPILPHPDGTYQTRVSVEVPTREGDTYACHVDHSSLEETLTFTWDPNAESKDKTYIVIAVVVALAIVIAAAGIGVIVWRRRSGSGGAAASIYAPAPNKEENPSTSSDSQQSSA
ncbi:class I histocompatibility antigen, F10 alpha chain-like [Hyperolius riggenbachi]|uniref:class I histocompatibility antigen, F10 alpha chain-like n=1 Tax=Hyperolius riggenbachi TaxID=752182 RepID=UPI0035A319EE